MLMLVVLLAKKAMSMAMARLAVMAPVWKALSINLCSKLCVSVKVVLRL